MTDAMTELYETIERRKYSSEPNSYTAYLFAQGVDKICKKLGEESAETIIAAKNGDPGQIAAEAADLIYHLLALLSERGVPWSDVAGELLVRAQKSGNKKETRHVDKNT